MKFGINAQVIIALLGALYILMVCKEKYRIEYAEGEPVAVEKVMKKQLSHKGPRPAVMPKPGSVDFIVNKVRRVDRPRPAVMPKPGSVVAVKAKKTSVAKAPIVAVKAKKIDVIEEEEEDMIEGQAMIEEEGMSTGAIAGITAVSIVALIAIMIMMRRLRR